MVVPAAGRHTGMVGLPASGRHYQNPPFEPHRRADVLPSPRHNRYQQKRRQANQPPALSSTQLNQSLHAPAT
jgi:hypothetical protein